MYKISIYGCAMFKKLVCQWVKQYHDWMYKLILKYSRTQNYFIQ